MISLVVSGLSPPSREDDAPSETPVMQSWDQARLMAHGRVRLHIQRGILRLLADRSPHSNSECFQLRGQPVTIYYDVHDPSLSTDKDKDKDKEAAGPNPSQERQQLSARKHGRVHISSQMVEWTIISQSKEMASYMLLNKPLFKAMKMSFSISLHWKCQGSSFAHHLTQLLSAPTLALQLSRQRGEGGTTSSATPVAATGSTHVVWGGASTSHDPRLRAMSDSLAAADNLPLPVDSGGSKARRTFKGVALAVRASVGNADKGFASHFKRPPKTPDSPLPFSSSQMGGGSTRGAEAPCVDLYRDFRSDALALTVRLSTEAACSTLHVNTMRWLLRFAEFFENDPDPIKRWVGRVHRDGSVRSKSLGDRSSFSKRIKTISLILASRDLELDCFHVGEHRVFTVDSAAAKAVVLAFKGHKLQFNVLLERAAQPLSSAESRVLQHAPSHLCTVTCESPNQESAVEMEDCEDATGNWDPVDMRVSLDKMVVFALPPSAASKSAQMLPGHPLLSADQVRYVKGETLKRQLRDQQDRQGGDGEPLSPKMPNTPQTPGTGEHADLHNALLRQVDVCVNVSGFKCVCMCVCVCLC
jgi:hypothetical protein